MKKYEVSLPVLAMLSFTVEANSKEEAEAKIAGIKEMSKLMEECYGYSFESVLEKPIAEEM